MTNIDLLWITPWHPIRHNGKWTFPALLYGYVDRLLTTVYNLVLDRGHIINASGTECVTLAHGLMDPVVKHDFFGTHAVVDSMKAQPGFAEGHPVFEDLVVVKDAEGNICGWREGAV